MFGAVAPDCSRQVGRGRLTALPKANSIAINDPQLAQRASVRERCRQPPDIAEHTRFILALESQDDDPGMLARWVGANVREIQIQRDQDSLLRSTPGNDRFIIRSRQVLVGNCVRNLSGLA